MMAYGCMNRYDKKQLMDFKPKHDYFVGIDSDGCVFDSMELKNKECFIPNIIKYWDLQGVSRVTRETAEFVNLYSRWRGTHRFPALVEVFDLLRERPEVKRRNIRIPEVGPLRAFIDSGVTVGNPALEKAVNDTGDPVLKHALTWSKAVNRTVAEMSKNIPLFPLVRECLERVSIEADIVVVSGTPGEALEREWKEYGIKQFVEILAGQELGTKQEHIEMASAGKYPDGHVLMIGDAPGDLSAAHHNGALFFPIVPGHEDASWEQFHDEIMELFLTGKYTKKREAELIDTFLSHLPEKPPWL